MDRRRFLTGLAAGLSAASLARMRAFAAAPKPARHEAAARVGLTSGQWRTLAVVQEHLLPSEPDAPGAQDCNALEYLQFMLGEAHTDPVERRLIRAGLEQLEKTALEVGRGPFLALDEKGRERVLRRMEKTPGGRNWIVMVLDYLFEALLSDPVYGGNPGGIGWKWLEFHPGFRRPPPDKRFYLL